MNNQVLELIAALERVAAIPGLLPGLLTAAAVLLLGIVLLRLALR